MNPADVRAVAETIILGLEENDKIESATMIPSEDEYKAVIGIETDTGELFFAEIIPA